MSSILLPRRFYSQPQGAVTLRPEYSNAIGLYRMEGRSLYDCSPTGAHADVTNYASARGKYGELALQGARGTYAISQRTLTAPPSGTPITFIGRIKPANTDTSQDSIIQIGQYVAGSAGEGRHFTFHTNIVSSGDIYLAFNGVDFKTAGGVISAGQYYDVEVIYKGGVLSTSSVTLSLNGVSVGLTKVGVASKVLNLYSDCPIRICRDNNSTSRDFRGVVDYLYLFTGVLLPEQMLSIRQNPWRLFRVPE